jgi:5-methylcytosine-specific restriction protein B
VPDKIDDILASWAAGRNALLYGPPATGKTRLISELFQALSDTKPSSRGIKLDPKNSKRPFSRPLKDMIPLPAKVVWTTFHQSYGYEDFVLGLRPEEIGGVMKLLPWAGVFLDAALELNDDHSEYKSVVIFIDEINRGNAARIFGEFMTFLDFDYREGGPVPLPVPLRHLTYFNGESEIIYRPGGAKTTISDSFSFPKHVYVVATMNSVDRAAVPIDSALARRFDRIEMRPDLDVLLSLWGLSWKDIPTPDEGNWQTLTPFQVGVLLLDQLNLTIADDLGPEFELGHGLLTPVKTTTAKPGEQPQAISENDAWQSLAKTWDDVVFPQLEDRYSGRPDQLIQLLKAEEPAPGDYAWQLRRLHNGTESARSLAPVRVSELSIEVIKRSFQWLVL